MRFGSLLATQALTAGFILFSAKSAASAAPPPIQVVFDVHQDPLNGIPLAQRPNVYAAWRDAANWVLNVCDARGARVTFLAVGEYYEYTLEDAAVGLPLMQRLYASGGSLGTHSHSEYQYGPHDWRNLPPNPPMNLVVQAWEDHVNMADAVVTAALGVTNPAEIRAINNIRGSHVPADGTARIDLMRQYGFTLHQQGPDEEFYAYFYHYPMNPYRPLGSAFLTHDPNGPVVVVPFGPVLGRNDVHFGIPQDMRVPAVQGRFLLELLNWLHDVFVARTDRVWVTGWGAHGSDLLAGAPTRAAVVPMLDWIKTQFVDQPVGGLQGAAFSSGPRSRDLYYGWEAAHPGEASFSYPASSTNWDLYPYLIPAAVYLTQAWYGSPMPPAGTVRWHSLTASAAAGGPYTLYVAYTADGASAVADLSAGLGAGDIAVVNPATGRSRVVATTAVEVDRAGVLLVPPDKVIVFPPPGDLDGDGDVDLSDFTLFQLCFGGSSNPLASPCPPGVDADLDNDGDVDLADFLIFQQNFTGSL